MLSAQSLSRGSLLICSRASWAASHMLLPCHAGGVRHSSTAIRACSSNATGVPMYDESMSPALLIGGMDAEEWRGAIPVGGGKPTSSEALESVAGFALAVLEALA